MLGDRIRELREEKSLNQLELAKLLNISNTTLSQYESGQRTPSDDIKMKMSKIFDVSVDYLLGNSDIKNPYKEEKHNKDHSEIDKFLLEVKETMIKQGIDFDETSPQELIETYKVLKEFKKKTESN